MINFRRYLYSKVATLSPLIIILVPLLYPKYERFFSSGFLTALYIVFIISLVLFSLQIYYWKRINIRISKVDIAFFIFMLYLLINGILKTRNYLINDDIFFLLLGILLFVSIRILFSKIPYLAVEALIILSLISGFINILFGYLQLFKVINSRSGLFEVTGLFVNPTVFCSYISFLFPIILYRILSTRSYIEKSLAIFICISIVLFDCFCLCRSALFGVLVILLISIITNIKHKRRGLIATYITGVILIGSFLLLVNTKSNSTQGRLLIWKISYAMFLKNPITGIGYGNYKKLYNKYQAQYFKLENRPIREISIADENYYSYDEFYNVLIEDGLVGLALFIFLLIVILRKSVLTETRVLTFQFYLILTILLILIVGMVSFPFQEPCLYAFFVLILAIYSSVTTTSSYHSVLSLKKSAIRAIGTSLLFMSTFFIFRVYYFYRWYYLVEQSNIDEDLLKSYHTVYPKLKENPFFLSNYANNLIENNERERAIHLLQEAIDIIPSPNHYLQLGELYYDLGFIKQAEINISEAMYITPQKFMPKYHLLQLYIETKQISKGKALAKEIVDMPVKIPSSQIVIIKKEAADYLLAH